MIGFYQKKEIIERLKYIGLILIVGLFFPTFQQEYYLGF